MAITEQETRKAVAEQTVTKIHGQPTNQDIDQLEDELTAIASSFPSDLGGGLHGHAGLVKNDVDYELFAPNTPFVFPANPGVYPQGNFSAAQRAQAEAEHKALIVQFQTCVGVSKGLKDLILQAVEEDFLLELRDEGIAYLNVTPLQMITHLRSRWGMIDYVDITALLQECDVPWNASEVPTRYFNRIDKARRQLARVNIKVDERAMLAKALKSFKDAGDYDAVIREWEAKPVANQTYTNLKVVMCTEFSKLNRQDATSARATGHAAINHVAEEMAQMTKELIAQLTDQHSKQIETMIKANDESMTKLTAAILANMSTKAGGTNANASNKTAKAAIWAEKKKNATKCPHCDKIHPNRTHDQCWELPTNAAKRPAGWKSVKSS